MDESNSITFSKDMHGWIVLRNLGKKIIMRAQSIDVRKQRITDEDDHRCFEAVAEGGVKVRSKLLDISKF